MTEPILKTSELGKKTAYPTQFDPSLLLGIPRQNKRDELQLTSPLPFFGEDIWLAYEVSWLNAVGKPMVAIAELRFPAASSHLVESKSLKLYLNSFNMAHWPSAAVVQQQIQHDLSETSGMTVAVKLFTLTELDQTPLLGRLPGILLDDLDVSCDAYTLQPQLLHTHDQLVEETLSTHLLKSNCLVTGQPDWGSMTIHYQGKRIDHPNLLRYLVSYRNHPEFHEQCVERCFWDIWRICQPEKLTISAQYTRRGGLDISPIRSSEPLTDSWQLQRTIRQ